MTTRNHNDGLRKICECPRRTWAKCRHPWHFSFKWQGTHYRFSLDRHLGRHVDSKTDAEREATNIKADIRAGRFGQPAARNGMTLRQLADTYLERYVAVERARTALAFRYAMNTICRTVITRPTGSSAPLGDWRLTDIVTDTIERFREVRRGQTGPVGTNRNLGSLRALFNWAIRVGYVDTSPFTRGAQPVVTLSQEHRRSRRLQGDEEGLLLPVCGSHLRAVVEAALETGMRHGEIASLQWSQVEGLAVRGSRMTWAPHATLVLPVREDEDPPRSTDSDLDPAQGDSGDAPARPGRIPRLNGRVRVRQRDRATGAEQQACVGGRRVEGARAHADLHRDRQPHREVTSGAVQDRVALPRSTREAGSRWLEGGVPLHTIRD